MAHETIFIVDDDEFMREGLVETLEAHPYRLEAFDDPQRALEAVADAPPALVITDMRMPGMSGIELLEKLHRMEPDLPVIMITAFATVETAVDAMKKGALDYIMKPFQAAEIEIVVEKALAHRRVLIENQYLKSELAAGFSSEVFVGESSVMRAVFGEIAQIAPSPSTVLIRGESGTGKELVARSIHAQSERSQKPFIRVNCAALSAGLLESELFGHEKGAFTGADKQRIGRFELAEGGTILLDEISEMDLALQGKLLRVLQEREYERVGSSETIRADVRILATSNRDLEDSIAEGAFRQDLFYRLNVVPIHLPPLRQRKEDVAPLARHFIMKHTNAGTGRVREIAQDALDLLVRYDWPGNVRELENIIERAIVLNREDTIRPEHLAAGIGAVSGGATAITPGDDFIIRPLAEIEREYVGRVLRHCDGHRQNTANALGISERSLRDRIKRWKDDGYDIE